jgi:hypothetical protein
MTVFGTVMVVTAGLLLAAVQTDDTIHETTGAGGASRPAIGKCRPARWKDNEDNGALYTVNHANGRHSPHYTCR